MAHPQATPRLLRTEDAVIALFCLPDDAYRLLNLRGGLYESLKRLSDSEVLTPALLQQLRGVESERSFLRDCERFFSHLFPGIPVAIVNPRQACDFVKAIGRLAKTDKIDAFVLARFARAVEPEASAIPDEEAMALQSILARRRQLIEMLVSENNRLKMAREETLAKRIRAHMRWLEK